MLVRPRLVVPADLAQWVSRWGRVSWRSSNGRLVTVGPFLVDEGAALLDVLDAMTALSAVWLRGHPEAPPVESLRYGREPEHENDYLALPVSLGYFDPEYFELTGHAPIVDCEDLEIGDSAEERVRGNLYARPIVQYVSERLRHVITDLGPKRGTRDLTRILLGRGQAWSP